MLLVDRLTVLARVLLDVLQSRREEGRITAALLAGGVRHLLMVELRVSLALRLTPRAHMRRTVVLLPASLRVLVATAGVCRCAARMLARAPILVAASRVRNTTAGMRGTGLRTIASIVILRRAPVGRGGDEVRRIGHR